ncbi:carboxyl transferase domain-containing protein, partial [Pseudonocardia acidicola]|uniref:carboxyl transferase domain-containing protein n=1 Tax=Pseudonocardia acidicola TaxID=2724939 RepID=UPI0023B26906
ADVPAAQAPPPGDAVAVRVPAPGTVIGVEVAEGERVAAGRALLVLEAMKMEHLVEAPAAGVVRRVDVAVGDTVAAGDVAVYLAETDGPATGTAVPTSEIDLDHIRDDLAHVLHRHAVGLDAARPEAVQRRRRTGHRTARENLDDLCDPGSFVEYGALAIAAQRQRRSVDDLIERTPADGMVAGTASINGDLVGPDRAQCAVMSYDYTVLAGTQGFHNHRKKDRLFELAERRRLPVVLFAEGGGGRPGDTDGSWVSMLDVPAFHLFGRLSGLVPLVGIVSGRCFAGNAALAGCCDVIIATADANLGMGGPAMIEGGGLGVVRPEEIGPMDVQVPNGVVDVLVADEAEAVAVAKRYLSYFQGPVADWEAPDQRVLRHLVPENRVRVYNVRAVIENLADAGSVLELRPGFGAGMVTALIRIEGRPMGLIANNPRHLGGAIDRDAADKAARFLQLCDAFALPVVSLCDTPGFMVGPDSERDATVRHFSRMFVIGANVEVPIGMIVLRKCYGLGAQSMGGGSTKSPAFCISWPTGEFGGMGLEGAVRLGYRKELEAVADPVEREELFAKLVATMYEDGKATNTATVFEIDDVIDPARTRRWIVEGFRSFRPVPAEGKRRRNVDTW